MAGDPTKPEENTKNIETTLGTQLGSDTTKLAKGGVDVDRLGKISEDERDCIAYFKRVNKYLGGNWLEKYFNDYQNLGVGVDGLGRSQVIQAIGASRGSNSSNIVKKPGIIKRITDPDWRKKLEAEGYTVID